MATRIYTQVPTAAWPWLITKLVRDQPGVPRLVVCPTGLAPETLAEALAALGITAQVLPAWDVQPYDRDSPSPAVQGQRLAVTQLLTAWGQGIKGAKTDKKTAAPVVVASLAAVGVKLVPPGSFPQPLRIRAGQRLALEQVIEQLVALGYLREDVVQEAGKFARRGGLVDVWPAADEQPLRLEWFDDEVESLRRFDPLTQRGEVVEGAQGENQRPAEVVKAAEIGPASELSLNLGQVTRFRERYRAYFPEGGDDEVYRLVSDGLTHGSLGQLLPLFFEEELPTLLEVLPATTQLILPDETAELAALWGETVQQAYVGRQEVGLKNGVGLRALPPELTYVWGEDLLRGLARFESVTLHRFDSSLPGAGVGGIRAHGWLAGSTNRHQAAVLAGKEVANRVAAGWRVVATARNAPALVQLQKVLAGEAETQKGSAGLAFRPVASLPAALARDGLSAVVSPLSHGWVDAVEKLLVVSAADVFGEKIGAAAKKAKKRTQEEMIAHFSELREGDTVVHEQHGIGRFAGLTTLSLDGGSQDFIKLLYADDDRLFVPVASLGLLSRYKGAEAGHVTLDRLGTGGWEIRKERVKEDLLAMADELIATAAARALVQRVPALTELGEHDALYEEFCGGFPYALTDDQASVLTDVEADLAAPAPMDRLVVGDVGFGKTEVALRAAFLMASAGRQVAVVCPTTLLARQHLDVFTQRFAGFPLQVGGLSRLVPAAQAKLVKAGMAAGTVDIVVGTHALLSKDVAFKNLGLVVIDEEQRFGVAHKERLKQLKLNAAGEAVDVLTLTATPIPRTLQLAVGGVRGLSLITTPPVDRLAVQSHVLAWDNKTLKEALQREIQRGGQVYVVAPHIEDLPQLGDDLAALVPAAKVGVAHGQMAESQLEDVMTAFYAGDVNVLLATTIIESGIDVPNANTLIVYRSDRFGLAQLYQLRGRVGRSTTRAFAYFLLPDGPLSGDAARRLQILQRLEGLGAGFTLASYDMDLRGFGNLLGKQQSGNIRDIGFELYTRMLQEAVAERSRYAHRASQDRPAAGSLSRSEEPQVPMVRGDVKLKLGVTYLIPESYVSDVATRLQLYRRLAQIGDEGGIREFAAELADRFGKLPGEVNCLLQVMSLRNRAAALNVNKVEVGERGVTVGFAHGSFANPAALIGYITKMAGVVTIRAAQDGSQLLVWHRHLGEGEKRLGGVAVILGELENL